MKVLARITILAMFVMILGGCTQSSIDSDAPLMLSDEQMQGRDTGEEDETLAREDNLLIDDDPPEPPYDWDQVRYDINDLITDTDKYTDSVRFEFTPDDDAQSVVMNWVLKDGADDAEALEYASYMVRDFNDAVAIQVTDIEMSTGSSFGSFWDIYSLSINIQDESGSVLLQKNYKAGETIDLEDFAEETEPGPEIVEDDSPKKV